MTKSLKFFFVVKLDSFKCHQWISGFILSQDPETNSVKHMNHGEEWEMKGRNFGHYLFLKKALTNNYAKTDRAIMSVVYKSAILKEVTSAPK